MKDATRYKDIVFYRILAGLKSEARNNYLGYFWFILEPLMSTGVFYFAMTHLTGQRGSKAVLTILIGMISWQWFEGAIMQSANSIKGKFHVHLQVPLPKYVFPLVDIGMTTVRFTFAFSIILIASLLTGQTTGLALIWLLPILLLQLFAIISISLTISIAVTLISDLLLILQTAFRLLFFTSGIFFSAERVPANLLPYFNANPITVFIESYRGIILENRQPNMQLLINSTCSILLIFTIGCAIQKYYDKRILKLTNV